MSCTQLHDRDEIEQFLRRDVYLHIYIYILGDLDDFFWPYTTFYGWRTNGDLDAVACYDRLGVEQVARYGKFMVVGKTLTGSTPRHSATAHLRGSSQRPPDDAG